jgi:hypothetical protein
MELDLRFATNHEMQAYVCCVRVGWTVRGKNGKLWPGVERRRGRFTPPSSSYSISILQLSESTSILLRPTSVRQHVGHSAPNSGASLIMMQRMLGSGSVHNQRLPMVTSISPHPQPETHLFPRCSWNFLFLPFETEPRPKAEADEKHHG